MSSNEMAPGSGEGRLSGAYDVSRLNAVRHGILSRYTILPWECEAEYKMLLDALVEEHAPVGPTEMHLVVELAGILWRKRRLRLAELATFQRGLENAADTNPRTVRAALVAKHSMGTKVDVEEAIRSGDMNVEDALAGLEADRQMTFAALEILGSGRNRAYEDALKALHESTMDAWSDQLDWEPDDYGEGVTPYGPDVGSLKAYLEAEILPWYKARRDEITVQPDVRQQALGEALDPDKLERLGRYEVHLDRKFERTLSTLIRLKQMRQSDAER
jgi:hypothetical protein